VTVIAANLREMAGDSRVTAGSLFFTADKIFKIGTSLVGMAGDAGLTNKWLAWFRKECPSDEVAMTLDEEHTFIGLVLTTDGLLVYTDCSEPDKLKDKFFAIGTGADIAMAAMALGKSPTEAVKLACALDPMHCGLPVKTMEIAAPQKRVRRPKIVTAHTNPTQGSHGEHAPDQVTS
jgi:ATP-dependent protease HslVU (ClpYQ) peptidase subunit